MKVKSESEVVSNSVRPHRCQPTRLLCPWDSPGKNTGVGCHFLLHITAEITEILNFVIIVILVFIIFNAYYAILKKMHCILLIGFRNYINVKMLCIYPSVTCSIFTKLYFGYPYIFMTSCGSLKCYT